MLAPPFYLLVQFAQKVVPGRKDLPQQLKASEIVNGSSLTMAMVMDQADASVPSVENVATTPLPVPREVEVGLHVRQGSLPHA
jgi:hypothetical protein